MTIALVYGTTQQFRYRHRDINILGHIDAALPLRRSVYSLNRGPEVTFYVKPPPDEDRTGRQKKGPSINRLEHDGDFNIEIPVAAPELEPGDNAIEIEIEDGNGETESLDMRFTYAPAPLPLPLDLTDLSQVENIQEIGQIVDGAFDVDPVQNVIRSRAPVGSDIVLVLGSPHGSQEATYDIRFSGTDNGIFLGLSDFFVGHEAEDPDVGVKPGYSSAGLATVKPDGEARTWLAWGDLSKRKEFWVVRTEPAAHFPAQKGILYRVRHQVIFKDGVDRARFRIWPADRPEPDAWLCEEDDSGVAHTFIKFSRASFALFQYFGTPTEWSNIRVTALSP